MKVILSYRCSSICFSDGEPYLTLREMQENLSDEEAGEGQHGGDGEESAPAETEEDDDDDDVLQEIVDLESHEGDGSGTDEENGEEDEEEDDEEDEEEEVPEESEEESD